jgi:hypothetical protein
MILVELKTVTTTATALLFCQCTFIINVIHHSDARRCRLHARHMAQAFIPIAATPAQLPPHFLEASNIALSSRLQTPDFT